MASISARRVPERKSEKWPQKKRKGPVSEKSFFFPDPFAAMRGRKKKEKKKKKVQRRKELEGGGEKEREKKREESGRKNVRAIASVLPPRRNRRRGEIPIAKIGGRGEKGGRTSSMPPNTHFTGAGNQPTEIERKAHKEGRAKKKKKGSCCLDDLRLKKKARGACRKKEGTPNQIHARFLLARAGKREKDAPGKGEQGGEGKIGKM